MKSIIFLALALSATVLTAQNVQSQENNRDFIVPETSKNAIGLRYGGSPTGKYELNYQRFLDTKKRLEFGLGYDNASYDTYSATAMYLRVFKITKGFNAYVGAGLQGGYYDYAEHPFDYTGQPKPSKFFLNAVGVLGLEYNFNIPLTISLDARPVLPIVDDLAGSWTLDLGLTARWRF